MTDAPTLGDRAKDVITGFEGIVTGRCEYLTGCEQVLLIPPVDKDGKRVDGEWFDIDRCTVSDVAAVTVGTKATVSSIARTSAGADKPAPVR